MLPRIAGILCLILVAAPMRAETISTNTTGLSTLSTCTSATETWQELGESCHSDKMFRRSVYQGTTQKDSRAYTVKEIDALRQAADNKYVWGFYSGPHPVCDGCLDTSGGVILGNGTIYNRSSRTYNEIEKTKVIEEQVRTWMQAGKTAQDLIDSEK